MPAGGLPGAAVSPRGGVARRRPLVIDADNWPFRAATVGAPSRTRGSRDSGAGGIRSLGRIDFLLQRRTLAAALSSSPLIRSLETLLGGYFVMRSARTHARLVYIGVLQLSRNCTTASGIIPREGLEFLGNEVYFVVEEIVVVIFDGKSVRSMKACFGG